MAPQVCTERAGDAPWGHDVTMKPGRGEAPARAAARRPAGPLDFESSCNGPGEGAGVPCDLRQQGPVGTALPSQLRASPRLLDPPDTRLVASFEHGVHPGTAVGFLQRETILFLRFSCPGPSVLTHQMKLMN